MDSRIHVELSASSERISQTLVESVYRTRQRQNSKSVHVPAKKISGCSGCISSCGDMAMKLEHRVPSRLAYRTNWSMCNPKPSKWTDIAAMSKAVCTEDDSSIVHHLTPLSKPSHIFPKKRVKLELVSKHNHLIAIIIFTPHHIPQQNIIRRRPPMIPHPLRLHAKENPHPPPKHLQHLHGEDPALEIVEVVQMRTELQAPCAPQHGVHDDRAVVEFLGVEPSVPT